MAADILTTLQVLGITDLLLWLLSFAIIFGILQQINLPNSKAARAIISVVIAFFVLMSPLRNAMGVLSSMSTGMLMIILAFIVLLAFAELGGVMHTKKGKHNFGKDAKGNDIIGEITEGIDLFTKHNYILAITFILIAILIFVSSGGMAALGITLPYGLDTTSAIFFIAIIIAIIWLIKGEKA